MRFGAARGAATCVSAIALKRSRLLRFALLRRQNFAAINPALHADHAVRGAGLGEAVINIRAQRVQRQAALEVPLRTGDFIAVQPSADANLDSFAAETQRG